MKTVLHVGCGSSAPEKLHPLFRSEEWHECRLDIDANVKPAIVASITSMSPVTSESVDAIWSSHNLEHLYSHEVPQALREFKRVLKPGGFVLITLPDLQAVAKVLAEGNLLKTLYQAPAGPISALDVIYGYRPSVARGNHYMAHRTGFTSETLAQSFLEVGFQTVLVKRGTCFDLWAKAFVEKIDNPDSSGL
jgi:ubiquinone/menaquinone biosynthesis C-methylase UbiE